MREQFCVWVCGWVCVSFTRPDDVMIQQGTSSRFPNLLVSLPLSRLGQPKNSSAGSGWHNGNVVSTNRNFWLSLVPR